MRATWPSQWGITTRLVMVASVPALLMFLAVTSALYISGRDEAVEAVRERGLLIASSLAQTSQYGLVSGNGASLERSMRRLLQSDSSIASIEVLDRQRKAVASVVANGRSNSHIFEKEIRSDVLEQDLLDNSQTASGPTVPGGASFKDGRVVGHVVVKMSAAPILAERLRRVAYSAAAVLVSMLASVLAGLSLAQRLRAPLRAVMGALREIRQGRYDVALTVRASGELGELQAVINEMAKGLSLRREELQSLVDSRTSELQLAMEKARIADTERRRLIARSNRQLEDERKRIAVEIHDHLNASLIGLRSKAQHIAEISGALGDKDAAKVIHMTADEITSTIATLYTSARNLIKQLRPEVIDVLGLTGALQEMTREYNQLVPAIRFSLEVAQQFPVLRGQVAIVAYRLVQEALSNVVKHSSATSAVVSLIASSEKPEVLVRVQDNGVGFDPGATPQGSLGLAGMRERVGGAGGSMRLRSRPGRGTRISFRLPLTDEDSSTA